MISTVLHAIYGTIRSQFVEFIRKFSLSDKKIKELFDCTTFLKNLWLYRFRLPKMKILEMQLAIK